MTSNQKIALPLLLLALAIPILMVVIKRRGASACPVCEMGAEGNGRARITYEPVFMQNTEEWEIVTDPVTGIPLKAIGHRKVSYG